MMCDLSLIKDLVIILLTLVLTVSTVYLAIYTYKLVNETREVRKAQLQPTISIHLEHAETDPTLIFILIQNVGQGIAYDLKFNIQKDLIDYGNVAIKIGERGLFKAGMKFCPPGYSKKYFLVETTKNYRQKMEEELIISARYRNIFHEPFDEVFHIQLKEQENYSLISPADTYIGRIAQSLNEIKKIIEGK